MVFLPQIIKPLISLITVIGLILLASCQQSGVVRPDSIDFAHVAQVSITADDTPAQIEAEYKGTVLHWHEDAGIALLGFTTAELGFSKLSDSSEPNLDTYHIFGSSSWGGGSSSWGGGSSSWGGGSSSWGGGSSSWGGGVGYQGNLPPQPQNSVFWKNLKLGEAYDAAQTWGGGVKVAVIDTGLDVTHPAFSHNLAPEEEWYDFVDNDYLPQEEGYGGVGYGHGTAVAGVIVQVAPDVEILPIRVLDGNGYGDTDNVIIAIYHAVAQQADIIQLSLGTNSFSQLLYEAIWYAKYMGVLVVASMGNEGMQTPLYPAKFEQDYYLKNIYAVGSINENNEFSLFSNYFTNQRVFSSYGENIFSTYPNEKGIYATGTSFAAPIFSGTLALMLACNSWNSWNVSSGYIQSYIKQEMHNSARRFWVDKQNQDARYYIPTNGRLNIYNFVASSCSYY